MRSIPANIITAAQKSYGKYNLPASIIIDQWIVESEWGEKQPKDVVTGQLSNNYFGMKAVGDVPFVTCLTHEQVNGKLEPVMARFRSYDNLQDCFDDHARLLTKGKPYLKFQPLVKSPLKFIAAFATTYATDSEYANTLTNLYNDHNLSQYDKKPQPVAPQVIATTASVTALATAAYLKTPPVMHQHFNFTEPMAFTVGLIVGVLAILVIAAIIHFNQYKNMAAIVGIAEPLKWHSTDNESEIQMAVRVAMEPVIAAIAKQQQEAADNTAANTDLQTKLDEANATIVQMTTDDTDTDAAVAAAAKVNPDGTPVAS